MWQDRLSKPTATAKAELKENVNTQRHLSHMSIWRLCNANFSTEPVEVALRQAAEAVCQRSGISDDVPSKSMPYSSYHIHPRGGSKYEQHSGAYAKSPFVASPKRETFAGGTATHRVVLSLLFVDREHATRNWKCWTHLDTCDSLATTTVQQSLWPEWHLLRNERFSASSNAHKICVHEADFEELAHNLCNQMTFWSEACEYGIEKKPTTKKSIRHIALERNTNVAVAWVECPQQILYCWMLHIN